MGSIEYVLQLAQTLSVFISLGYKLFLLPLIELVDIRVVLNKLLIVQPIVPPTHKLGDWACSWKSLWALRALNDRLSPPQIGLLSNNSEHSLTELVPEKPLINF